MDKGADGGKPTRTGEAQARFAGEVAQGAARLVAALGGVLARMEQGPREGDAELRATLARLAMEVDTQRLRALDIASGESERRKRPLADALARAAAQGGDEAWRFAMASLAQYALGEERPAWYAGSLLAHMGLAASEMDPEAAKALVGPLDMELSLGATGSRWDWDAPGGEASRGAWMAMAARAGVCWPA